MYTVSAITFLHDGRQMNAQVSFSTLSECGAWAQSYVSSRLRMVERRAVASRRVVQSIAFAVSGHDCDPVTFFTPCQYESDVRVARSRVSEILRREA
jgi:hypothetical protein